MLKAASDDSISHSPYSIIHFTYYVRSLFIKVVFLLLLLGKSQSLVWNLLDSPHQDPEERYD